MTLPPLESMFAPSFSSAKPCPWCGVEGSYRFVEDQGYVQLACLQCGARGPRIQTLAGYRDDSNKLAKLAWNASGSSHISVIRAFDPCLLHAVVNEDGTTKTETRTYTLPNSEIRVRLFSPASDDSVYRSNIFLVYVPDVSSLAMRACSFEPPTIGPLDYGDREPHEIQPHLLDANGWLDLSPFKSITVEFVHYRRGEHFNKEHDRQKPTKLELAVDALQKLAKLGGGRSDGNVIAQYALKDIDQVS